MREIKLTQGKVAIVDDDDFEALNKFKWCVSKYPNDRFYAVRSEWKQGSSIGIRMHRTILGIQDPKTDIDHIDGNGLNNQKHNLRACTRPQNQHNKGKYKNNTSGIKGVYWHKTARKWAAKIRLNGKNIHIGLFEDINIAASAYDEAAKKYHGNFAKLNFPAQ